MASLEIDSKDVIRLMLQFMKENNLANSMRELQTESDVTLNTVDNLESFISDIQRGHWDSVISQVSLLKLPREKMVEFKLVAIFFSIPLRSEAHNNLSDD